MEHFERHTHWENIYQSKDAKDVSWYQEEPIVSLDIIKNANLPLDATIIDIGGGESLLVDHLLTLGFQDISILDVSETAIQKAQERLGPKADLVKWIVSDIVQFQPQDQYDLWHDRATFHFLTEKEDIQKYIEIVHNGIKKDGNLIIGTFSEKGPEKCSGIRIQQYSQASMADLFNPHFEKVYCTNVDHTTPFNTVQNFTFCHFKKR